MKKSIFLFFAAILCATSAWAHNLAANQYVYFEKPSDWEAAQLLIGKSNWSEGYTMTKISNTNLYYLKTIKWDGYTEYYFFEKKDKWGGEGKSPTNRTPWTGKTSSKYTSAIAKYHLFNSTKSIKSSTTSTTAYATVVNRTQTIKVQLKDGSNWEDATVVPADLTASTYALTSATAAGAKSASLTKESTTVSATVDAAYSAKVTLSCTNVLDGYMFEGWYDANGNKITSYTVSDAHTVYARFIQSAEETNEVSVTYMCGTTSVATAISETVGVESEKSFTAPTVTGYKFTNWTIGAGIDLKVGTASDATITVVTKSASSDYTLVANYEEVIETVYFINTNKWARVNIHKWNGKAAASSWPGEKLTASGEKIGEYDVYSYTAKQGDYANIIFNSKTSSTDGSNAQTGDLTWTAGKYYIYNYGGKSGWYTKEEAEELLVVPVVEETIYFVNNKKWTKVQAYAWNSTGNNTWPGVALTATGEKVAGYDVYSYTAPQGYVNVIFNNKTGDSGEQSADFVWTNGKYYCMGADANYAGGTQENVETIIAEYALAANVYLAGEMTNPDNWDINKKAFKKATADATTATVTVALAAKTYKFKLVVDGAWKGNGGIMKRGENAVHEGGWSFDEDKDCQIVADIAGDYTFTWNLTDKKLTVTYPPLPKHQVTATVNPAETGTVTGIGEYEQGSTATLVAAPAANYAFKNWTEGGEEVSTEATYSFKVTKAVELVANFVPEETHEVTVSYLCNATPIPGQTTQTLAVGITTPSTITAPTIKNYKFDSWTLGTGVQSENVTTANPIQITTLASGEYTLAANYTKIELTYNVTVPAGTEKCYIAGDMTTEWSFVEMTKVDDTHFTITIEGATTEHKYKYACQADWAYVEKKADGSEADNRTYNANDVVAKWAELAKCYLMGNGDWDNGVEMEYDSENGQYILLAHYISAPFKFKMGDEWSDKVENNTANGVTWTDEDEDGNYDINLPVGYYDFFFKKDSKKVYIAAATPYTREVRQGYYGTICLPTAGQMVGASIFEIAYKDASKIYFDEIVSGEMEAGIPYIFLPNEGVTTLKVFYTEMAVVAAGSRNGLVGYYDNTDNMFNVPVGNYILLNNQYCEVVGTKAYIMQNYSYIVLEDVPDPDSAPALAPGARRVSMGVAGQNTATGVDQVEGDNVPTKMIINGQLFILRGEKMYDAQGKLVK